jgi:hypothetical protein
MVMATKGKGIKVRPLRVANRPMVIVRQGTATANPVTVITRVTASPMAAIGIPATTAIIRVTASPMAIASPKTKGTANPMTMAGQTSPVIIGTGLSTVRTVRTA